VRRGLRLHYRIVVPFVLVSLVTASVAAIVALSVASRALRSRASEQLFSTARVIGRSDLALNPAILRSVRDVTGIEIVTISGEGRVLASTADNGDLPERVRQALLASKTHPGVDTAALHMDCGFPCLAAVRRLESRPDVTAVLIADTSAVVATTRSITKSVVLTAALSILVMVLVSQMIARRVTAPIDRLVTFARETATQDVQRRAHTGDDEIGRLGAAFNDMLDRLDASKHALVRSEKLVLAGLLAARVAHDIRNPLSSIKMQTQLLQGALRKEPELERAAAAVLRDTAQVESVIRDLLELARPGDLKLSVVSLNDLVSDVLEQMSPQLSHSKIRVSLALDPRLPVLSMDVERLKRAIVNVIANALEAMPRGGRLDVTTRCEDDRALLEICDEGTGIPADLLERVFDPFVSTKRDGMGLGLVNVKAVVEQHGGGVILHGREGPGTCARLWLPASGDAGARFGKAPHG
jgi:signal transduction histidine kinase